MPDRKMRAPESTKVEKRIGDKSQTIRTFRNLNPPQRLGKTPLRVHILIQSIQHLADVLNSMTNGVFFDLFRLFTEQDRSGCALLSESVERLFVFTVGKFGRYPINRLLLFRRHRST